jgi:hypothetical protein
MATETSAHLKNAYETDFVQWVEITAQQLRDRAYEAVESGIPQSS